MNGPVQCFILARAPIMEHWGETPTRIGWSIGGKKLIY